MPLTAFWNSNELPHLVTLYSNVLNCGGHILNLAYQHGHLRSLHCWLSLLYVQLKNIVSATTTQHISVKGVARFCVSGQVIKSFFAYGRILKGKVIQLYIELELSNFGEWNISICLIKWFFSTLFLEPCHDT